MAVNDELRISDEELEIADLAIFVFGKVVETEGAELIDSVLDVVRKEAEGCDCL